MRINASMRSLLEKHGICAIDRIVQNSAYPIWQKTDDAGRTYWGTASFWELDRHPISANHDLSQLEWDGNEVCLSAQSDAEIAEILKQAIGLIAFWKCELEMRYPETPFYILASYDDGDLLILDEGEFPTESITLRFWAERGSAPILNLESFEDWAQPAILAFCNFAP